jgi:nicotinamidase/pyrazinamidase
MSGRTKSALLVVDVQNDFCPGGALAVEGGDRVVSAMNRYIDQAMSSGMTVYASRDWHPAVTSHFKEYGGPWPVHCVQNTPGAKFHPDLKLPRNAVIVTKGTDPEKPGYSAFDGEVSPGKSFLADILDRGITHLYVGGLATDYCVRQSVLSALTDRLKVTVLEDAIAGVNPGDSVNALAEMRQQGAGVTSGADALAVRH